MDSVIVLDSLSLKLLSKFNKISDEQKANVLNLLDKYIPEEQDIPDDFFTSLYESEEYKVRQKCLADSFGLSLETWFSLSDDQQMEMMGITND